MAQYCKYNNKCFSQIILIRAIRSTEFIVFYDWETCKVIRRIDIVAKKIYWNEAGSLITISTTDDLYVLAYNKQVTFFKKIKIIIY